MRPHDVQASVAALRFALEFYPPFDHQRGRDIVSRETGKEPRFSFAPAEP